MSVRFLREVGCTAYPDSRSESRIVVAGAPPFGHSVLVEKVVAEGLGERAASHELLGSKRTVRVSPRFAEWQRLHPVVQNVRARSSHPCSCPGYSRLVKHECTRICASSESRTATADSSSCTPSRLHS